MGFFILRAVVLLLTLLLAFQFRPPSLDPLDLSGLLYGVVAAALIFTAEFLVRRRELSVVLGQ